jgi:hypothetical protein
LSPWPTLFGLRLNSLVHSKVPTRCQDAQQSWNWSRRFSGSIAPVASRSERELKSRIFDLRVMARQPLAGVSVGNQPNPAKHGETMTLWFHSTILATTLAATVAVGIASAASYSDAAPGIAAKADRLPVPEMDRSYHIVESEKDGVTVLARFPVTEKLPPVSFDPQPQSKSLQ